MRDGRGPTTQLRGASHHTTPLHGSFTRAKGSLSGGARPASAIGSIPEGDAEVAGINAKASLRGKQTRKAKRRAKTSMEYYPSTRRSASMWNEGVEFTAPHPARFQLPTLPSVDDLNSGMRDLEVWPSGQTSAAGGDMSAGPSKSLSKPKLLLELESYVSQQLFLLEDNDSGRFDPEHFQVYRNVFQFFIDKLHTYRPLLSSIKLEYELLLDDSIARLQAVEPIQAELDTLEEKCAREVNVLMMEHKESLDKLKKKLANKEKDIERLKGEEAAMQKETKRVEHNISAVEERRQQVHQSNIALVGSLRFYEDWLQQFTRPENYETLLKGTQAEVTSALLEMQKLKKAVESKVEREELDEVLDRMRSLREMVRVKEEDLDRIEVTAERTHKSCLALEADVAKLEAQVTGLTPRPLWDTLCMQSIDFPPGVSSDTNVNELAKAVRALQKEIMDLRDELPPELQSDDEDEEADEDWVDQKYFEGLGLGDEVPAYFKWEGKIRNRKLSKRDTESLIKHFWKQKDQVDAKRPKRMPVDEWFMDFLKNKYTIPEEIVDWAYNLVDAALRYKYDADCEMFWKVITHQLDESVYWDEFEMTNGFIALLQKLDMNETGGKVTGRIPKNTLVKAMRKWFPCKTDIRFNKLKRALNKEEAAAGPKVHYVHLFAEDKDFNQGPFAEMVRDQHLEERVEYLEDLEVSLQERAKGGPLNSEKVLAAIVAIDPKKGERGQESYCKMGLGLAKNEKLDASRTISVEDFLQNLSRGVVKTSTKRDEIGIEAPNDAPGAS